MKKQLKCAFKIGICFTICIFHIANPLTAKAYQCGYSDKDMSDGYKCCGQYHTFGHGNILTTLNGGSYGNRFISVDSGFTDSEITTINNAISNWNSKLTSVNANGAFYLVKQQNNEQIKVTPARLEAGTLGITRFFQAGGGQIIVKPNGALPSKYKQSVIYLDSSKKVQKKIVAHEIGHAMGLSHRLCNTNSIMYNFESGIEVSAPQTVDAKTVYHLYH